MGEIVKIQTVVAPIRPAKSTDFFYEVEVELKGKKGEPAQRGLEKRRKIGLTYVAMRNDGRMEFYTLHAGSSSEEINLLIRAKRCFVIADVNGVDYDSEVKEIEVNWIKPEVKQ